MDRLQPALDWLQQVLPRDPPDLSRLNVNVPKLAAAAGAAAAGYVAARYCWELIPISGYQRKAIFISGCDSGFGRELALRCAKAGFTVFSGCLTQEGRDSLAREAAGLPLHPAPLDVTKDESVREARRIVGEKLGDKVLWAVVNNAGIFSCYGPAEWSTPDEYKLSFEVNLLGNVRVTNAFLDLLKLSRGRIISVASVSGRVSVAGAAPYSVAKYGVEAWNDAIRRELRGFGITVHLLEPGAFKATNLLDDSAHANRVNSVWKKLSPQLQEEYGEEYRRRIIDYWNSHIHKVGSERTHYVVDNYYHALTAYYPRLRYQCGWDSILVYVPAAFMPTPVQDFLFNMLAPKGKPIPACLKGGQYKKSN